MDDNDKDDSGSMTDDWDYQEDWYDYDYDDEDEYYDWENEEEDSAEYDEMSELEIMYGVFDGIVDYIGFLSAVNMF